MTTHTETQAMCERLDEIQRRVDSATEGPWGYRPDEFDDWGYIRQPNRMVVAVSRACIECDLDDFRERRADPYEPNGQFIAHAREDIPYLLALLTRQQETIDRLTEALETIAESHDAGRHDGLPEPCPAHEDVAMWAIARAALQAKP